MHSHTLSGFLRLHSIISSAIPASFLILLASTAIRQVFILTLKAWSSGPGFFTLSGRLYFCKDGEFAGLESGFKLNAQPRL
jgi:hypothetical protein